MIEPSAPRSGSIWHKFNTEPRHFCFWLALAGLLGMAAAVALSILSDHALPGLHWLWLAGVLAFLIGTPGFVLAWIPPMRRGFAWLLRYKSIIAAGLVTMVALFYAVENWRGRLAWQNFVRGCEAEGIYFSLEKIAPLPVPAEQNMFETAPWTEVSLVKTNGQFRSPPSKEWFAIGGARTSDLPDGANFQVGRRENLKAWQNFFRFTNSFPTASGERTNYFQLPETVSATPGRDVLLALDKFSTRLQQVRLAAARPHARFDINYEDGFAALLPHLAHMKSICQYLRLRSSALLAEGDSATALKDIQLALRITDAIHDEPTLISHLVQIACVSITLNNIWEGLADHRWNDAQLLALNRALTKVDFLSSYQAGMDGERYFEAWSIDFVQKRRDWRMFVNSVEGGEQQPGLGQKVLDAVGRLNLQLAPAGWFDQNKCSLGRMQRDLIRPSVDVAKRLVLPELTRRADAAMQGWRPTPYNLFAGMLMPALSKAAQKTALAQTHVNEVRIAIALERHRLAHNQYPETLLTLSPDFITELPRDIINGQPLKYRRSEDGSFILYSVGWNGSDEGGEVVPVKNSARPDIEKGDWVWRYPAR